EREAARAVEHDFGDGPGEPGEDADRARPEALEHVLGPAEIVPGPHLGDPPRPLDLAERSRRDPGPGDRLRSHRDASPGGPEVARGSDQDRQDGRNLDQGLSHALVISAMSRRRCARMNSVTNGSAGFRARSLTVPLWRILPARMMAISPA